MRRDFEAMAGKTVTSITGCRVGSEDMAIAFADGSICRMWHNKDCCESIRIEEIHGDYADFVGQVIVSAEASEVEIAVPMDDGKQTDTFYKLACAKGYLTIRWLGESNGYYGTTVDVDWQGQ
jgi:hypothetical protein